MTDAAIADTPGGVSPDGRRLFRTAQALQDAIVFRRARAGSYCHDCDQSPGGRCDDHACDLDLIAGYEEDARVIRAAIDENAISVPASPHC